MGALTAQTMSARPTPAPLGLPINQEDLTYTLLTFGLMIPEGLKKWGCPLDQDDCDAFLHTWLVVGSIMGIRNDLMPETYAQAQEFLPWPNNAMPAAPRWGKSSPHR